jgi:hypothetical protein
MISMGSRKPPTTDAERLANLREALSTPDDDDDELTAEEIAAAEASGIDFAAWAAEIRWKAEARLDAERHPREPEPEPPKPRARKAPPAPSFSSAFADSVYKDKK